MTATPLGCPRCHNEQIIKESNTYPTPLGNITVEKNKCPNCGSRFIFEEDLSGIFAAAQIPRGK